MKPWVRALFKSPGWWVLVLALMWLSLAPAAELPRSLHAAGLYTRYLQLAPELAHNQFSRPLHLDSTQTDSLLQGEISAVVEHPFTQVQTVLQQPANWCKVLMLHINVQSCALRRAAAGTRLAMGLGQKSPGLLNQVYPLDFDYQMVLSGPDYFEVQLSAAQGPLATRDYRLVFRATRLDAATTFLQLGYSYSFGFAGRLAMQSYLATAGRDKIGFTLLPGAAGAGAGRYVGGMRGLVERNAMRYFLAIDAHLDSYAVPEDKRFEAGLAAWFDATEVYAPQLHELDRAEYLAKKRAEQLRPAAP